MSDRKPFEPADGVSARWRKLYAFVQTKSVGDEITYSEAEELLDCDRMVVLGAMRETRIQLEADGERSLRTVANFGWIVMNAAQEIDEIEKRKRRAGNRVKDGIRIGKSVNNRRDELSPFERERLDREQRALQMLSDLMSRRRKPLGEMHGTQGEIAS